MPFTNLPDDNLISVITHLPPADIFSVRKACKRLYDITHARIVWTNACIKCISYGYPFPNITLKSMSISGLEKAAYDSHRLGQKWFYASKSLRPHLVLHRNGISSAPISDVQFIRGNGNRWLVTVSKSVWSVLMLWVINYACRSDGISARKCTEWSPKGGIITSLCLNNDPASEATLAIGLLHEGNEMLHVLSVTGDVDTATFNTVAFFSTNFKPVALQGDLVALSDEQSQVTIWNWRTNHYATLRIEQEELKAWKHSSCNQVIFSHSTKSVLVVRDQSIYLFPYPELRATAQSPITYTHIANHHFGWIDGISLALVQPPQGSYGTIADFLYGEPALSISILLRRKNSDLWYSDTHSMEYYTLVPSPPTVEECPATTSRGQDLPADDPKPSCNLPYIFPPCLRSRILNLRGALGSLIRCSNMMLGRNGTAVWINPRDRSAGGLLFSDDGLPLQGVEHSNERLMAAVFHGPLSPENPEVDAVEICTNDRNNWTALAYDEDTGRIAMGSSSGDLTIIIL